MTSTEPPAVVPASAEVRAEEQRRTAAQEAQSLISQCSEVRVRVNWFKTSSKIAAEDAVGMLKDTGADRAAVAMSKRLITSKHPVVKAANQAKSAIDSLVKSYTVPMLAVRSINEEAVATMRKDAGVRLIQKKDMAEFDRRLDHLTQELYAAVRALQNALPEIKQQDRERLGKLYREGDYPADVVALVSVEKAYKSTAIDLDWQTLCPAIYQREARIAQARMNQVVENAATEFSTRFIEYVQQVCNQLGQRVRLKPRHKDFAKYDEAEVTNQRDHATNPDEVPEGSIQVQVRHGDGTSEWLQPMTPEFYDRELRPYETKERNRFNTSSIVHLREEIESFLHIGDMLGPYKGAIQDGVRRVQQILIDASHDQDPEKIAAEARRSDYMRNNLRTALSGVANLVRDSVETVQQVRRSVLDISFDELEAETA